MTVVPDLIRQILEEEAWQEFENKMGKHVFNNRFEDFVTTPPLAGLGISMDLVRRVVGNDPVTLDLLDQAIGNRQGQRTDLQADFVDNINEVTVDASHTSRRTPD